MKHTDIEELLSRREAGTLSDADLAELNTLAGRDDVFANADRQVAAIRRARRRRATALVTVGVLALGATLLLTLPQRETTLVAEQRMPVTSPTDEYPVESLGATVEASAAAARRAVSRQAPAPSPVTARHTMNTAANNTARPDRVLPFVPGITGLLTALPASGASPSPYPIPRRAAAKALGVPTPRWTSRIIRAETSGYSTMPQPRPISVRSSTNTFITAKPRSPAKGIYQDSKTYR